TLRHEGLWVGEVLRHAMHDPLAEPDDITRRYPGAIDLHGFACPSQQHPGRRIESQRLIDYHLQVRQMCQVLNGGRATNQDSGQLISAAPLRKRKGPSPWARSLSVSPSSHRSVTKFITLKTNVFQTLTPVSLLVSYPSLTRKKAHHARVFNLHQMPHLLQGT